MSLHHPPLHQSSSSLWHCHCLPNLQVLELCKLPCMKVVLTAIMFLQLLFLISVVDILGMCPFVDQKRHVPWRRNFCRDKIMFVVTNMCLSWQNFCCDNICLNKHNFVMTSILLSQQIHVYHGRTYLLSRQNHVCRDRYLL